MAPVPKKELMAKMRRERKKDDTKWEEHLMKDRQRKKEEYVKKKRCMSALELEEQREKTRLKVQKCRLKKKMANIGKSGSPSKSKYKTPQSLGKAVKKVCSALPKSPGKKSIVIKEIVKTFSPDICKKLFTSSKKIIKENKTKKHVIEFYCSDNISRQAPGKRDVKSVKNEDTGKKEKIPIRHMTMNITDAFYEFKRQNTHTKIGLSTFFSWRPKFVLLASQTPHNVCVCKKHLNFSFLVEAIHACTNLFPSKYKDLLQNVCCDQKTENCMFNFCRNCKYDVSTLLPSDTNLSLTAKRKKWEEVEGYLQVTEEVCSLKDLIGEVNKQLPSFKMHCLIKKVQFDYFDDCKNRGDESEAVVQVDFAENATLTAQNQIQSAHWKERHVTIFTCVIWSVGNTESLVIISDDLDHSKYAVWTFLKLIGGFIKTKFPRVDHLIIFSDNAASQFRNRHSMANLCYLEEDLDFRYVEWTTFAASHGKGAVDGVGGALKNTLWHKVKSENLNINSAVEYYELALRTCKKTNVFFISKDEIDQNKEMLNNRWLKVRKLEYKIKLSNGKEKAIGLNSLHYFEKHNAQNILAGVTAKSKLQKIKVLDSDTEDDSEMEFEEDLSHSDNKKMRYSEVFSSDSEDETVKSNCNTLKPSTSTGQISEFKITGKNIQSGTYVLIDIKGESRKNTYSYVGVCQSSICEEGEVQVMFMRAVGGSKKIFRMDENDIKFIKLEQIKKILKTPEVKIAGLNRIQYEFQKAVKEVNEA